jgi:hypothetical protein
MSGLKVAIARRGRGGFRSRALLALLPLVACAKVFGIDSGRPLANAGGSPGAGTTAGGARAGRSGGGGRTAQGGRAQGGAAAVTLGDGGVPGEAGAGGERVNTGDTGGQDTSAAAGSEGANVGAAGAAGAAPEPPGLARLGTPCDDEGAFACSDATTTLEVTCHSGTWIPSRPCTDNQRCDPARPGCWDVDPDCAELAFNGPACKDNEVLDCSPNLYTELHLVCPFGCADGACVPGGDGQLTLHTGIMPAQNKWTSDIPVCLVLPKGADVAALHARIAIVHSEVESVWNRFLGVVFTGFGDCDADTAGVRVSFPSACGGHLVNDVMIGTPGIGAVIPLEICASYDDGSGQSKNVEEPLTRLLARHQFGHVLGLNDGDDARDTLMVRGVELGHEDEIVPTTYDYDSLEGNEYYVGKPDMALVTPVGECVGAAEPLASSGLAVGTCDGTDLEKWLNPSNRLEAYRFPPEYCAEQVVAGAPVTLSTCPLASSTGDFYMPSVKWRTPTSCVATASSQFEVGTNLVTSPCTAASDPTQAWYFENLAAVEPNWPSPPVTGFFARIHLVGTELCVAVENDPTLGYATLALDTCLDTADLKGPQVFQLQSVRPWSGTTQTISMMANGPSTINWQVDGGDVFLGEPGSRSGWFLSGSLVNDAGLVLTRADDDTLVAEEPASEPAPNQLFDYYF